MLELKSGESWLFGTGDAATTARRLCLLMPGRMELANPAKLLTNVGSVERMGSEVRRARWGSPEYRRYGSYQYEMRFRMRRDGDGRPFIESSCTCRSGDLCQHVVVALIKACVEEVKGFGEIIKSGALKQYMVSAGAASMLLRLDGIAYVQGGAEEPKALALEDGTKKNHLVYVLMNGDGPGAITMLGLRSWNVLKSGEYGNKEERYVWSDMELLVRRNRGHEEFEHDGNDIKGCHYTDDDKRVARLMFMEGALSQEQYLNLSGQKMVEAFDLMVGTGRVRLLKNADKALKRGPARAAEALWVNNGNDTWSLKAQVDGGGVILPMDPPWYVCEDSGLLGPVSTPWQASTLQMLCSNVALSELEMLDFGSQMQELDPQLALGIPKPPEIEVIDGGMIKPKPTLTLTWAPRDRLFEGKRVPGVSSRGVADSKLTFNYAGVEVDGDGADTVALWDGNRKTVYQRDRRFEEQCWSMVCPPSLKSVMVRTKTNVFYGEVDYFDELAIAKLVRFQRELAPMLHKVGWDVHLSALWPGRYVRAERFTSKQGELDKGWLDFELTAEIDGKPIDMLSVITEAMGHQGILADIANPNRQDVSWTFKQTNGYFVSMTVKQLAGLLPLVQALSQSPKTGKYRIGRFDIGAIQAAERATDARLMEVPSLVELVECFANVPKVLPASTLKLMARPAWESQVFAAGWCAVRRAQGLGGIIADEYAVGKTCQTLITMCDAWHEAEGSGRPSLVIVTKTLFFEGRWQEDAEKFLPSMPILLIGTGKSVKHLDTCGSAAVVITTYDVVLQHFERFKGIGWNVIGCDEAHKLGNSNTNLYRVVDGLDARQKLMITGSPMQNTPREMWALMNLCVAGLLRDKAWFNRTYPKLKTLSTTTELEGATSAAQQSEAEFANRARLMCLGTMIGPFELRRTNAELGRVLPEVSTVVKKLKLPGWQANIYEAIRVIKKQEVLDVVREEGLQKSKMHIFAMMTKLRQACCDPRLLDKNTKVSLPGKPAKVAAILEICEDFLADGKRVIIVSEWTEWLMLLKGDLAEAGIDSAMITGKIKSGKRRKVESQLFRSGERSVMLLQLAMGEGIELPEADVMISCEPWWNAKREDQCLARMRRDERNKSLTAIRLRIPMSVEDGVVRVAERKLDDIEAVNEGQARGAKALTMDDVEAFFSIPERDDD